MKFIIVSAFTLLISNVSFADCWCAMVDWEDTCIKVSCDDGQNPMEPPILMMARILGETFGASKAATQSVRLESKKHPLLPSSAK